MKEVIKEISKIGISYIAYLLFAPLKLCPIKRNRVLFTSLTGGKFMEYSCNPKYICEELERQGIGNYEIVWALEEPQNYSFLKEREMILVKHFTLRAFYYLLTSHVIVTNGSYVSWFPFRKKQTIINTWHGGGAYKRLDTGAGSTEALVKRRNAQTGKHTTTFITSSKAFTKYVVREAFQFQGTVLEVGMPRNDFLVNQELNKAEQSVRQYFELNSDIQIMLYAPTYREKNSYDRLDTKKVIEQLEQQTGKEWVCLLRLHRYEETMNSFERNHKQKNAAAYPDMQELLAATDVLISDYSSSIWDYSFLERPCFLYVPDLEKYKSNRGFYVDFEKWHFPYAKTQSEFLELLKEKDTIDWKNEMNIHQKELKSCETGHSAKSVVQYIIRECNEKNRL